MSTTATPQDPYLHQQAIENTQRLRQLRELRLTQALQAMTREQQRTLPYRQRVAQCQNHLQHCQHLQQQHQQTLGPSAAQPESSDFTISQLQAAIDWARALEAKTLQAATQLRNAQAQLARQEARLAEQRRLWQRAQVGVEKTLQLHERLQAQSRQAREQRAEDELEEAALPAWLRQAIAASARASKANHAR